VQWVNSLRNEIRCEMTQPKQKKQRPGQRGATCGPTGGVAPDDAKWLREPGWRTSWPLLSCTSDSFYWMIMALNQIFTYLLTYLLTYLSILIRLALPRSQWLWAIAPKQYILASPLEIKECKQDLKVVNPR